MVGFLDGADALHQSADAAVRDLTQTEDILVSAISYAEILTGARLAHHDESKVLGFFDELVARVLSVDVPIADRAASIRAHNRGLRLPDALIVASAELTPGVTRLLSADATIAKLPDLSCEVEVLSVAG